jgi:hypothetical protein
MKCSVLIRTLDCYSLASRLNVCDATIQQHAYYRLSHIIENPLQGDIEFFAGVDFDFASVELYADLGLFETG